MCVSPRDELYLLAKDSTSWLEGVDGNPIGNKTEHRARLSSTNCSAVVLQDVKIGALQKRKKAARSPRIIFRL